MWIELVCCCVIERVLLIVWFKLPLHSFTPLIYLSVFSVIYYLFCVILHIVIQILRRSKCWCELEDDFGAFLYLSYRFSIFFWFNSLICNIGNKTFYFFWVNYWIMLILLSILIWWDDWSDDIHFEFHCEFWNIWKVCVLCLSSILKYWIYSLICKSGVLGCYKTCQTQVHLSTLLTASHP